MGQACLTDQFNEGTAPDACNIHFLLPRQDGVVQEVAVLMSTDLAKFVKDNVEPLVADAVKDVCLEANGAVKHYDFSTVQNAIKSSYDNTVNEARTIQDAIKEELGYNTGEPISSDVNVFNPSVLGASAASEYAMF